ncbi:MAG: hypothetical protein K2Z81_01475, partial [Cyanobacteria bacterium]|nr:hypothetical protein [Cyanobacteriota bacterium]
MNEPQKMAKILGQQTGNGDENADDVVKVGYGESILAGRNHSQITAYDGGETYRRKFFWLVLFYAICITSMALSPIPMFLLSGTGVFVICYLIFASLFMTHNQISFTKEEVRFPWYFYFPLGRRLSCSWSEIGEIALVDNSPSKSLGHRIEFRLLSGDKASIQLCRIDDEELDLLCRQLERNAPHAVSTETVDRIRNWHNSESTNSKALTLFEQSATYLSNRYSLISFMPTQPNSMLNLVYHINERPLACGGISALHAAQVAQGAALPHRKSILLREYWIGWLPDPEREAFLTEISDCIHSSSNSLAQPGLLRPTDFFIDADRFFIAHEELPDSTLAMLWPRAKRVKNRGASTNETILRLAEVLEQMHGCETPIIHGTLDPEAVRFLGTRPLIITPP